ncbi:MAG: response regulator [Rhodobiaceae bacterium]|nr:response regulator [Rhodobiaceae bacterium]MCC0056472.1 response regulator [Rhodobiaceae bacterium]
MKKHHLAYGTPLSELDIVVVDDHRGTQAMLRSMLSVFRVARVRSFDNGEDALRSMTVEPPSVLITDWEMRPMSGLRLLAIMRHEKMHPLCLVPALMVTGHASLPMIEKAFAGGIHHMLVKPVAPARLLQRLTWLIQDERQMVLEDERWRIEGVEEVIEKRIKPLRNTVLMERLRPKGDGEDRENEVIEAIVDDTAPIETAHETLAPVKIRRAPARPAQPPARSKASRWHGWRL